MKVILLLHVLGACIWTGGHLVLSFCILPDVLKNKDLNLIKNFEGRFERIGIPALLTQVVTGFYMAGPMLNAQLLDYSAGQWLALKLGLLLTTLLLAADARLRIIPKLTEQNLNALAWHIIPVTVVAVLFVIAGLGVHVGGY